MDANGQIYFAPEDEIPEDDARRLRDAEFQSFQEQFERLRQDRTLHDAKSLAKVTAVRDAVDPLSLVPRD